MSDHAMSIEIDRPVRTVYDQWTQFESFPSFMDGVESVTQLDDRRVHWVASIAGRRREWDAEITQQEPDRVIAWESIDGARNAGTVRFTELTPERTRVTLELEFEPDGLVEQVGDKLGLVSSRAEADLERFKDFIEQRHDATGSWRGSL